MFGLLPGCSINGLPPECMVSYPVTRMYGLSQTIWYVTYIILLLLEYICLSSECMVHHQNAGYVTNKYGLCLKRMGCHNNA